MGKFICSLQIFTKFFFFVKVRKVFIPDVGRLLFYLVDAPFIRQWLLQACWLHCIVMLASFIKEKKCPLTICNNEDSWHIFACELFQWYFTKAYRNDAISVHMHFIKMHICSVVSAIKPQKRVCVDVHVSMFARMWTWRGNDDYVGCIYLHVYRFDAHNQQITRREVWWVIFYNISCPLCFPS